MSFRTISSRTLRSISLKPIHQTSIQRLSSYSIKNASVRIRSSQIIQPQSFSPQQIRLGSSTSLAKDDIQRRVLEVLGTFEKCDPTKITPTASFTSDLGLDSLDAVEVVMAIEEEFSIEIPDEEADKITTISEAISYIERTPEAI
ncbi:acyl carrier protein-like protein [Melampsora americana]|nr:acyl carrier protein-like protein [Melampsora americana]